MNDKNRYNKIALSQKEKDVLHWIRHGKNNPEIASLLKISESTVKFHIANVLEKLNALNRIHAVAIALERKLLE